MNGKFLKGGPRMRRSRFTKQQIVAALRQAESGTPVVEVWRKLGFTEQTFYRWKRNLLAWGWLSCDGGGRARRKTAGSNSW
jgi:transposase-like protein